LVVENAGRVIAEWKWRATNTGPLALPDGTEMPATGKSVELLGVSVVEVRDGEIAVVRDYFDNAGLMSQLRPMPGTSGD
jgi:hypothetical protein